MKKKTLKKAAGLLDDFGRHGDTHVVHVNPREIALLAAMGGRGSKNPRTGLLEFFTGEADSPADIGDPSGFGGFGGPSNPDDRGGMPTADTSFEGFAEQSAFAPPEVTASVVDGLRDMLSGRVSPTAVANLGLGLMSAALGPLGLAGRAATSLADALGVPRDSDQSPKGSMEGGSQGAPMAPGIAAPSQPLSVPMPRITAPPDPQELLRRLQAQPNYWQGDRFIIPGLLG